MIEIKFFLQSGKKKFSPFLSTGCKLPTPTKRKLARGLLINLFPPLLIYFAAKWKQYLTLFCSVFITNFGPNGKLPTPTKRKLARGLLNNLFPPLLIYFAAKWKQYLTLFCTVFNTNFSPQWILLKMNSETKLNTIFHYMIS
jgi:hypothetical protein